jgi:HNH endonuclease
MASGERFYLLELTHRPAVYGDLGNILKIEGVVVGGEGARAVLMLPSSEPLDNDGRVLYGLFENTPPWSWLTMDEWTDFIKRSDDPEVLISGSLEKIFHRKLRYEISGATQQKIWVADGLICVYCHQPMGKVQLTVDHFHPLETGGANDTSNYLSACKKCNKLKGSMPAEMWCSKLRPEYGNYQHYIDYLANRQLP